MVSALDPTTPTASAATKGKVCAGVVGLAKETGGEPPRSAFSADAIGADKEQSVGEAILARGGGKGADDLWLTEKVGLAAIHLVGISLLGPTANAIAG